MAKQTKKSSRRIREPKPAERGPIGGQPGTLSIPPEAMPSNARVVAYGPDKVIERELGEPESVREELEEFPVVWIDIVGLGDTNLIQHIGKIFSLHPLALEDATKTHQRAKVEEYPHGHYMVVRMPHFDAEPGLDLEQVSIFVGDRYVVTVQEREGDCFDNVRERIRAARGRIRRGGPDYLAYSLLDAVVDAYFPEIEWYGDRLEAIEDRILESPTEACVKEVHGIKRDLLAMRRTLWPLREAVNNLMREEHPNIASDTRLYLRDVLDHTVQLVELVEMHREIAAGCVEIYLSNVSNRMNEVMKVLTIIATIFIPLSFIAGVWGMNFDPDASGLNMPELRWRYGYPFALGVMSLVAFGLLYYFRRRKWF